MIVGRIMVDGSPVGVIKVSITVGSEGAPPLGGNFAIAPIDVPENLEGDIGDHSGHGPRSHHAPALSARGTRLDKQPTFRRGIRPRGKAPPAKPPHFGFSAGAWTARKLEQQFPKLNVIKIGAPEVRGNLSLPGAHMDLPATLRCRSSLVR